MPFVPAHFFRYLTRPIPCDRDAEVTAYLQTAPYRDNGWVVNRDVASILAAYAERMSMRAVRDQDPSWVRLGLVAYSGAMVGTTDPRDVIPVAALLWDSAERLGLNSSMEFTDAAALVGIGGDPLISFAARPASERSIEVMGYEIVDDDSGFTYRRAW